MSDGTTRAVRNESVGPYMYTRGDITRDDGYRLVLYGAFNAMGLIGTEYNGIAVLDNNRMQVWCDNIGQQPSGWCYEDSEPRQSTYDLFNRLAMLPTEAFVAEVNTYPRCRYNV